jgi:hypothetical protein
MHKLDAARITLQTLWVNRRLARLRGLVHAQHAMAFAPVVHAIRFLAWTLKLHTKEIRQQQGVHLLGRFTYEKGRSLFLQNRLSVAPCFASAHELATENAMMSACLV